MTFTSEKTTRPVTSYFSSSAEVKNEDKYGLQITPSSVSVRTFSPLLLENSDKYDKLFLKE